MASCDATCAVAYFNLGGPRDLSGVSAFMGDLLGDPDVVSLPRPLRSLVSTAARLGRTGRVRRHYRAIGGGSPIFAQMRRQAGSIAADLGPGYMVIDCYSHSDPSVESAVAEASARGARSLVALPAYPHHSRATTVAPFARLARAARDRGMIFSRVGSWCREPEYIEALWETLSPSLEDGARVIVVAHGLPMRQAVRGDPYVPEVAATFEILARRMPSSVGCSLAFQSRLGPVRWTGPYLVDEVRRAGREGAKALVVVPVSFACENLETLYELDVEIARIARSAGIGRYTRIPAFGNHPLYARGLARLVRDRRAGDPSHE